MKNFFVVLFTAIITGALTAFLFMLLFNYFAPLFNLPLFGFWESWGILILVNIVGRRFNNITFIKD